MKEIDPPPEHYFTNILKYLLQKVFFLEVIKFTVFCTKKNLMGDSPQEKFLITPLSTI